MDQPPSEKPKRKVGRPFVKGQSGNPGGRPRQRVEFIEACRKDLPEIRRILMSIAMNEREDAKDRIRACELIAAYGAGKPAVVDFEGNNPDTQVINVFVPDLAS